MGDKGWKMVGGLRRKVRVVSKGGWKMDAEIQERVINLPARIHQKRHLKYYHNLNII